MTPNTPNAQEAVVSEEVKPMEVEMGDLGSNINDGDEEEGHEADKQTEQEIAVAALPDADINYFEGLGGTMIYYQSMTFIARERHDENDLMKLIGEVLRRCRNADPTFTGLSTDKKVIDIDRLSSSGQVQLDYLFKYESVPNKKSGRWTYTVTIDFMARQRVNSLKSKITFDYLRNQRIWIKEASKIRLPMKRCGWISHLPRYTVCDVLFTQGVINTVAKKMTQEETQKIIDIVRKETKEEDDEFTRFGPENVGRYLTLDWNTITYGPNTNLAKCFALELLCPKILDDVFTEILARIFFLEKTPFPFGVGEFRPPYFSKNQFEPGAAMAIINEQEAMSNQWAGLELYHLHDPGRPYKNTGMTIADYIVKKTGGQSILPTAESESIGKYLVKVPRGREKMDRCMRWYNTEMRAYFEEMGIQKEGWPPTSTFCNGYKTESKDSAMHAMCKALHEKVTQATVRQQTVPTQHSVPWSTPVLT